MTVVLIAIALIAFVFGQGQSLSMQQHNILMQVYINIGQPPPIPLVQSVRQLHSPIICRLQCRKLPTVC